MDPDALIRLAAFQKLTRMRSEIGLLTAEDLQAGFEFEGTRVPFANTRRGIWKPRQMKYLLSIKTVCPKAGGRVWYEDQYKAREQVYSAEEFVTYSFQGTDPEGYDNQWLREAMIQGIPIIYFFGVAPGRYEALYPVFIQDWSAENLAVRVAAGQIARSGFDLATMTPPKSEIERRYAMREVKQRLHQASFREAVLSAYHSRCAISGLPAPLLLDAAHIIPDADGEYGAPVVRNGLLLSKIHHAAFDGHLIGIDPDYRLHVSERLLEIHDGPMLEFGIKKKNGEKIRVPHDDLKKPDKERLARRFELFKRHAA